MRYSNDVNMIPIDYRMMRPMNNFMYPGQFQGRNSLAMDTPSTTNGATPRFDTNSNLMGTGQFSANRDSKDCLK